MLSLILLALAAVLWIALCALLLPLPGWDQLARNIFAPFARWIAIGLWIMLAAFGAAMARRAELSTVETVGAGICLAVALAGAWMAIRVLADGTAPAWLALSAVMPPVIFAAAAVLAASERGRALLRTPMILIPLLVVLFGLAAVSWWFAWQQIRRNAAEAAQMEAIRTRKP